MKALRFTLIAVIIACTTVALASADNFKAKPKKVINCTFIKAIHTPGLVYAMRTQLSPSFLGNDQEYYTVSVTYGGTLYRITGSKAQWRSFFNPKWQISTEVLGTMNSQ